MENTIALDSGRNEPQFLAALQASRNLDIPFQDLKAKMTGSDSMSLGAAIKASKPGMSDSEAKEAANKAERQAKETKEKISAHANAMADAAANAKAKASGKEDEEPSSETHARRGFQNWVLLSTTSTSSEIHVSCGSARR